MYFPLDKLLDYTGNRYELARACMEYAKKIRMLGVDEYVKSGEKDALVALKAILEGDVKFINQEKIVDEMDDDLIDFLEIEDPNQKLSE